MSDITRTMYVAPGPVDFAQLRQELAAVAAIIDANDVGGQVAVYTDGEPAAGFAAVVAAHSPAATIPAPSVEEKVEQLLEVLATASTLEEVATAAAEIAGTA